MKEVTFLKQSNFKKIPIDYSWSFSDKTIKDTSYITHGYYTYPAKFIPQLASRLIKENSNENDVVIDPFLGSGTTIVEAILNNRIGVGTDINDIAFLVSKVKTTPIKKPILLEILNKIELESHGLFKRNTQRIVPENERIDYWFLPKQKEKLSNIFAQIVEIKNNDVRDFFLVAFAQILKSCSIWLQKSIKPTRDKDKKNYDPLTLFLNQSRKMIKKHLEFDETLSKEVRQNIDKYRIAQCGDSRNLPCENDAATLVVTSPPYVTSYEYADLHQLPSLWFGYFSELPKFRKKFIGSSYKDRNNIDLKTSIGEEIVLKLGETKKSREVRNYFSDMLETFLEMKRVLKEGGRACVVIGNTEFKGIKILNAEVFQEQFENIGFKTHNIIHREIPSKMLPSTRDIKTGQFVKASEKKLKLAYPTEYILIMEKL